MRRKPKNSPGLSQTQSLNRRRMIGLRKSLLQSLLKRPTQLPEQKKASTYPKTIQQKHPTRKTPTHLAQPPGQPATLLQKQLKQKMHQKPPPRQQQHQKPPPRQPMPTFPPSSRSSRATASWNPAAAKPRPPQAIPFPWTICCPGRSYPRMSPPLRAAARWSACPASI